MNPNRNSCLFRSTAVVLLLVMVACNGNDSSNEGVVDQAALKNEEIRKHEFLSCMYHDTYFPKSLVDECKKILLGLCKEIETNRPENNKELYELTHVSTDRLNDLQDDFVRQNSEIETGARECLGMEFEFVANAYGFDADVEELISNRDW